MANIRLLKNRIRTVGNISKITKTMKMVAASKMQKAQTQALSSRPYAQALLESFHTLSEYIDTSFHPLLTSHDEGVDVAVVFTTNKGLCGSLNTHLLKQLISWNKGFPDGKVIMIGKKGVNFAKVYGLDLYAQFVDLPDKATTSDIVVLNSLIVDNFLNKSIKSVTLIYMDFINTLIQKAKVVKLLPLNLKGQLEEEKKVETVHKKDYVFEPNAEEILNKLLPFYIENTIYHALLEAKASEHSARMVAMKNANENALELVDELQLIYNKSRQESITNELLDMTSARMTIG